MGTVHPFPSSDRSREHEISDPRARKFAKLEEVMEKKRFLPSDLEVLGRNWHTILTELKRSPNFRAVKVYGALLRQGSDADAQKRSTNFEVPARLSGDKLRKRVRKLTQAGKLWLKLIRQAAIESGTPLHDLLGELLKGTSLVPASVSSLLDTPDPSTAIFRLAFAACERIANETELGTYYKNWDRAWIRYRNKDGAFLAGGIARMIATSDEDAPQTPENDEFFSTGFYYFDEEGQPAHRFLGDGKPPLPSAQFAETTRFGPIGAIAFYRDPSMDPDGPREQRTISIEFGREYRLAIGADTVTGTLTPALEIRNAVRIIESESKARIHISGGEDWWDDIKQILEKHRENREDSDSGDTDTADDDRNEILFWGHLQLELPEGSRWCELFSTVGRSELSELEERMSREEEDDEVGNHLSYNAFDRCYFQLTPGNIDKLLKVGCSGAYPREPLLSGLGKAMSALEAQLMRGTGEGTLFERLLTDARKKTRDFNAVYEKILQGVVDKHRDALAEFGSARS